MIPVDVRRVQKNGPGNLWKYVNYPDPRDDEMWKTKWDNWDNDQRPQAIASWLDANFIRKNWISIGDGDCTCIMFNPETRLCMAHDDRPPICRDYPWYGNPAERYAEAGLISKRCSFWLDIPKDRWPKGIGIKPLRTPVKLLKEKRTITP